MSFYHETSKSGRWHVGDVVRLFDGPFGDGVVLGFDDADQVLVHRPYAYVSSVGTTGPTVLLDSERVVYGTPDRFVKVGEGRTTQ